MTYVNEHYLKLKAGYLFPEIARRVKSFKENHPEADIIKMGIGDVTRPLAPAITEAFKKAVEEMGNPETFRGYGPEQGYDFLREAIFKNEYHHVKSAAISEDDIFISDGSKCDTGNIQEIFSKESRVAIPDPVYPVYVDTTVMAGKTGSADANGRYHNIEYLTCHEDKGFIPPLPEKKADLIFLCFPNNPTGSTASKDDLKKWVEYARENQAVILFDAAYEAFIRTPGIPHSIYEIEGADEVAIEFRSFSKTAGFTGTRCAWTVIPEKLKARTLDGDTISIKKLWARRHTTKFNGVSYPVQRAAEAVYSEEGKKQVKTVIDGYLQNASMIRESLEKTGFTVYGGIDSPYVWTKGQYPSSWNMFDMFLQKAHVVGTPGAGFGAAGEGFFRFSAFADENDVREAMNRIRNL